MRNTTLSLAITLALVAGFISLVAPASVKAHDRVIFDCPFDLDDFGGGGQYTLLSDLTSNGDCIHIGASVSDVTIDFNGFTLTGPGTGVGRGVDIEGGSHNISIHSSRAGGTITGFGTGHLCVTPL
jgi:hypothetical protein